MYSKKEKIELLEFLWEEKSVHCLDHVDRVATRPRGLVSYILEGESVVVVNNKGEPLHRLGSYESVDYDGQFNCSFVPIESLTDEELDIISDIEDETGVDRYEMLDAQYNMAKNWLEEWYIKNDKYDLDLDTVNEGW